MPVQAQNKVSPQAKAYMGKVRTWSWETVDRSYRGREAKAKCSIGGTTRQQERLAVVADTRYLTRIPTDPCLAH
jgi:hypothetical protein